MAAAVVFDYSSAPFRGLERLTDSKLMTREARETAYPLVLQRAARVSCVAFSPATIDRVGLHRCNLAALCTALDSLAGEYSLAVVDAFDLKRPELNARAIIGADYKSAAVAAASVVAKVVRDRLMRSLAVEYPEYGFEEHVGYATGRHREALRVHGPVRHPPPQLSRRGLPSTRAVGRRPGARRSAGFRSGDAVALRLLLQEPLPGQIVEDRDQLVQVAGGTGQHGAHGVRRRGPGAIASSASRALARISRREPANGDWTVWCLLFRLGLP